MTDHSIRRLSGTVLLLLGFCARPGHAQLDLSRGQRAADGTVYEVIAVNNQPLLGNVDLMRVTTVAGSVSGVSSCSSGGGGAGQTLSALAGTNPLVPQVLHDYADIIRTGILTPSDLTVTFNPANGGRLTIGTGPGALEVCHNASDCSGCGTVAPTFPLSSSSGGIPTACIATGVTAQCSGSAALTTLAFGLPASGSPPFCVGSPTTRPLVCDSPPADGFNLQKGQAVVFIYNHSLAQSGFTYGAGGFGIDLDTSIYCGASNKVITADGQSPSAPPPLPAATPTPTITPTRTRTPTSTATATSTPTPDPCGNGVLDFGEMCDDGNEIDNDLCPNDCFYDQCRPNAPGAVPGYCGSRNNDCVEELCTFPPPPQDGPGGLPGNFLKCRDGDPSCDASPTDGICDFRFSLCYNMDETRYPCSHTGTIERIKFRRPSEDLPRGLIDQQNRDAIESGLKALGGKVQGKCKNGAKKGVPCASDNDCNSSPGSGDGRCAARSVFFNPPLTTKNICTPPITFRVPLRATNAGLAFGRAELRIRSHEKKPAKPDGDVMKFICQP